jgi:hypothetical protein
VPAIAPNATSALSTQVMFAFSLLSVSTLRKANSCQFLFAKFVTSHWGTILVRSRYSACRPVCSQPDDCRKGKKWEREAGKNDIGPKMENHGKSGETRAGNLLLIVLIAIKYDTASRLQVDNSLLHDHGPKCNATISHKNPKVSIAEVSLQVTSGCGDIRSTSIISSLGKA